MGTTVEVIGPDLSGFDGAIDAVRDRFATEERRCSRFRGDSELTRVNRAAGDWTPISDELGEVLDAALAAAARTDGRFDPTVHDALVAAGYDRDFDEILAGARGALHPAVPCGRWREIARRPGACRLPAGVHIDLGGIAKGWTVDRAVQDARRLLPWVLVNAGGDLSVDGPAPWIAVDVEDPEAPGATVLRLSLGGGALATTSIRRRAWGDDRHHVIDPSTGAPARTEVAQATVWATTCADAEVAATDAVLSGIEAARRYPAVLVATTGEVVVSIANGTPVAA